GNDTFTINSTQGAATPSFQEDTTVNAGAGADTVHINDVTDLLTVNGQDGNDTINVNYTETGSVTTLNGDAGNDTFNIRAMDGRVNVRGGDDEDTITVSNNAPSLPPGPRTTPTGNIDSINALLDVDGGNGSQDTLNIDDSAAPASDSQAGTLTSSSLTGLEL